MSFCLILVFWTRLPCLQSQVSFNWSSASWKRLWRFSGASDGWRLFLYIERCNKAISFWFRTIKSIARLNLLDVQYSYLIGFLLLINHRILAPWMLENSPACTTDSPAAELPVLLLFQLAGRCQNMCKHPLLFLAATSLWSYAWPSYQPTPQNMTSPRHSLHRLSQP